MVDYLFFSTKHQANRRSRAPSVGRVYKEETDGTQSLIDVDTPHVASVESSFLSQEIKTTTQAERKEREEEAEVRKVTEESREAAKKDRRSRLGRNKSNPVVVGNALLIALLGAGLGVGAYKKHLHGQLSWQLVGVWTGVVGAVSAVNYFCSRYVLFRLCALVHSGLC